MPITEHVGSVQTNEITAESRLVLLRLMQLSSSNLPVGGYTFSQGLEYAIGAGWLVDVDDVSEWIEQVSMTTLQYSDLPLIKRQYQSADDLNFDASQHWNNLALSIRETRELLLADTAMGGALLRLTSSLCEAQQLTVRLPEYFYNKTFPLSFISVFSWLASGLNVPLEEAATAYCWMLLENQVIAATKLLPLGQTAAQLLLLKLSKKMQNLNEQAFLVEDSSIGMSLPGLAMASAKHETQYTRLYRS